MKYPNDANGDALRRMEEAGDDLTRPRSIDFVVVFPDGDGAKPFANQLHAQGYAASVEFTKTDEEFPWDVVVVKRMLPLMKESEPLRIHCSRQRVPLGGTMMDGVACQSRLPHL